MKIVILDGYTENPGDLSWGELEKLGELTVYDRTPFENTGEIIQRIGDAEIVITNKNADYQGNHGLLYQYKIHRYAGDRI